jgi:hypothetical protein
MEAKFLFQLHQLPAFGQSGGTFDIVGEHEREFFSVRPARPASGRLSHGFIDGPDILAGFAFPAGHDPAQRHPKTPRQIGLEIIIDTAGRHGMNQLKVKSRNLKLCNREKEYPAHKGPAKNLSAAAK